MPSATVAPKLTGRIIEEGTRGQGVPALLVEAWVGDEHGSQKAGSAYTDAEGNFSVQLADLTLVERRPVSAEVVVSDRDGVLIHRHSLRTLAPGGKEAGTGTDIWVDNLGLGPHELRLDVRTRAGTGVATSRFEVTEAEGA